MVRGPALDRRHHARQVEVLRLGLARGYGQAEDAAHCRRAHVDAVAPEEGGEEGQKPGDGAALLRAMMRRGAEEAEAVREELVRDGGPPEDVDGGLQDGLDDDFLEVGETGSVFGRDEGFGRVVYGDDGEFGDLGVVWVVVDGLHEGFVLARDGLSSFESSVMGDHC